jgi:hypothetical protein
MSKITLTGNVSGTGTFTIASPNSNTDRTLTLPDASGTALTTGSVGAVTETMLASGSVTQAKLTTLVVPIGVGQTWQNLTGSRSVGVTYTNSTGRPIVVSINGIGSTFANPVRIIVDGLAIAQYEPISLGNTQAIVPSGSTYIFFAPNGTTSVMELR